MLSTLGQSVDGLGRLYQIYVSNYQLMAWEDFIKYMSAVTS
jgi:hypothetical protein